MAGKTPEESGSEGAGQAAGSKAGARGRGRRNDKQPEAAEHPHAAVQASSPAELPVDSLKDAAPYLRRPFTVEAVKWKVQATWPRSQPHTALVVPYIDARLVTDRLNMVCPDLWKPHYESAGDRLMWCYLTVDRVTRPDVGEGKGKALVSDALKRAAKLFGIGVSLNAIPKVILKLENGHLKRQGDDGLMLTDEGTLACRGLYANWLDGQGRKQFGEPLDHGDAMDSVGAPEEEQDTAGEPERLPVEGAEADGLREQIRETFQELQAIDSTVVTPAEYARRHREADYSVVGLTELAGFLREKLAEQKVSA